MRRSTQSSRTGNIECYDRRNEDQPQGPSLTVAQAKGDVQIAHKEPNRDGEAGHVVEKHRLRIEVAKEIAECMLHLTMSSDELGVK